MICTLTALNSFAQPENRWQQRANYKMTIDMDAAKNQFKGRQTLEYSNNSDKSLNRVFYHLYFYQVLCYAHPYCCLAEKR